jgi:hypothetical protein
VPFGSAPAVVFRPGADPREVAPGETLLELRP